MYTIVGGDGQRYGPISAEQLRQWIAEGRANGQTLTYREGGEWKPLATYAEFSDLLSKTPGQALPPPPGTTGPATAELDASSPPAFPATTSVQVARSMVQVPGVLLAVTGGIGGALYGFNLLMRLFGVQITPPSFGSNPEFDHIFEFFAGGAGAALDVVWLGLSLVVLFGGLQMLRLQRYTFCLCTAIIALLPCISPCCCIGLPAGIWALVILSRPEIRAAFDRAPGWGVS
jgi:hypothetical protein